MTLQVELENDIAKMTSQIESRNYVTMLHAYCLCIKIAIWFTLAKNGCTITLWQRMSFSIKRITAGVLVLSYKSKNHFAYVSTFWIFHIKDLFGCLKKGNNIINFQEGSNPEPLQPRWSLNKKKYRIYTTINWYDHGI